MSDDEYEEMCKCGHNKGDHHLWWMVNGGGTHADECEAYGFNETGGMKPVRWRCWIFFRLLPPARWVYDRDESGTVIAGTGHQHKRTRLRNAARRIIRGPLYVDHCHHFTPVGGS